MRESTFVRVTIFSAILKRAKCSHLTVPMFNEGKEYEYRVNRYVDRPFSNLYIENVTGVDNNLVKGRKKQSQFENRFQVNINHTKLIEKISYK